MNQRRRTGFRRWRWTAATAPLFMLLAACQGERGGVEASLAAYRDRMIAESPSPDKNERSDADERARRHNPRAPLAYPVAAQSELPPRESLMTQPAASSQPTLHQILATAPDPTEAEFYLDKRLEMLTQEYENRDITHPVRSFKRVVDEAKTYIARIGLAKKRRLSLAECVQRAIQNNYTIRFESYSPAIAQTNIVEAEAAFDAEFFLDSSWQKNDPPTSKDYPAFQSDSRSVSGGFRQLLPSGLQASTSLQTARNATETGEKIDQFQQDYGTSFLATLRQPLLRGFGLDVNRATIRLRVADRDIAREAFLGRVRDTLLQVEQAYWQLVAARRNAVILAETTAQNWVTAKNTEARLIQDATEVEVANALSTYKRRVVDFEEAIRNVRDAEDQLKNLMNDPEFTLATDVEIIPTELPLATALTLDHFAEVRAALDHRSEIRESRRRIDQTRIGGQVAKNATLPQLDLSFQYEVQGAGVTFDNASDDLGTNQSRSYALSVQFSYPIGNRRAEAGLRRARLQESQAIVGLQKITDDVVLEVNNAIRQLITRFQQIPTQFDAVLAAERNLRSLQARASRIDPPYLDTELRAVENLAATRSALLQQLIDYNVGIVELERAKGTLLEFNNVSVLDVASPR